MKGVYTMNEKFIERRRCTIYEFTYKERFFRIIEFPTQTIELYDIVMTPAGSVIDHPWGVFCLATMGFDRKKVRKIKELRKIVNKAGQVCRDQPVL